MTPSAWHYRVRVRLVRERAGKFGPTLSCAGDIAALVSAEMVGLDREQFMALHLDPKNRLISREIVSIGHLTAALVHPREVGNFQGDGIRCEGVQGHQRQPGAGVFDRDCCTQSV